jgi:hypothetical protein
MNFEYKKVGKNYPPVSILINGIKYGYKTLRRNLPYIIEYNRVTKNYYLINRDYEYIGYQNIKSLENIENDIDRNQKDYGWTREYLFNDGTTPWSDKNNFKTYIELYQNIIDLEQLNELKNDNIKIKVMELIK